MRYFDFNSPKNRFKYIERYKHNIELLIGNGMTRKGICNIPFEYFVYTNLTAQQTMMMMMLLSSL